MLSTTDCHQQLLICMRNDCNAQISPVQRIVFPAHIYIRVLSLLCAQRAYQH